MLCTMKVLSALALVVAAAGCTGSATFTVENHLETPLKVEAALDLDAAPGVRAGSLSWLVEPGTVSTRSLRVEPRQGERSPPPLDAIVELTPIALVRGTVPPATIVILREPGPFRLRVGGSPAALSVERLDGASRPMLGPTIRVLEAPPLR